jgi:hypothetical protein
MTLVLTTMSGGNGSYLFPRRRTLDEALMVAGAAPLWNGNDERRPMQSTTTGKDSRVDDNNVSATVTVCFTLSIARL